MSNRKNKDESQERLKQADREKSSDSAFTKVNNDFVEKYSKVRGNVSSVFTKKSKFPIGLDIFISILLILVVAALVVGAYFLIIKFDDAYDNATVEYVLLVDKSQAEGIVKGDNVYIDRYGSAVYLGNIIEVDDKVEVASAEETSYVLVKIYADAQYRDDEGYSIDDEKIAVGRSMNVRVKNMAILCEIVDLSVLKFK